MLQRAKEQRKTLQTEERRPKWIDHIVRRNCVLKHIIEGKTERRIEVMARRGIRHKQLLDDLKGKRDYWKLKEEGLDSTLWRTCFGRDCGPVVGHELMNIFGTFVIQHHPKILSSLGFRSSEFLQ